MTPRYTTIIVLTVLALLGAANQVTAQDWVGSGRVKGLVTDLDGNPIEGAEVYYRNVNDEKLGPPPMITNKKGKFSFLGLKGGTWWVRVKAEGYYDWQSPEPVQVYSTGVTEPVEPRMEPIPEEEMIGRARYEASGFIEAGDELAGEGDNAGARAQYAQALEHLPEADHPVVLASVAATYINEGNMAEAKATLETALAIDDSHVESLKVMATIVAAEANLEAAEAILARIPEDEDLHPTTTINMALANFNKGDMEQAKSYLDRTLRDHPDVAPTYYYRGLVNLNLGDSDGAKADFEKFIELDPESPNAAEAKEYLSYLSGEGSG